jgi:hypothetical protein
MMMNLKIKMSSKSRKGMSMNSDDDDNNKNDDDDDNNNNHHDNEKNTDDDGMHDKIEEVVCELGKYSTLHVCKGEIDDKKQ